MDGKPKRVKRRRSAKPLTQDPRRLWRARYTAGKTLRQAADAAGISFGHLSDLENGRQSAGVKTLAALAQAYGLDIGDLLSDEAGPADEPHGAVAA